MKGVSELFSTMILASTIIVISIIVLYYALTTLEIGYASTEYGYIKSTFVNVANNIYYIVQGNAYAASIPSRSVGIGYKEYSDLRFRIIVDGNIIYEDTPKAVVAETLKPLVTHSEIVYGSSGNNPIGCSFMVNNLRLTPCVYEYYSRGWSIAELNTARPYVTVYEASESSFSYLRRINITNNFPHDLVNYTVKIVIDTQSLISAGKLRPDAGDIRFYDPGEGIYLSYWIDPSTINTPNTIIWVKIPEIPASTTKTIYMYYGNPGLTSASDPYKTFFIFENFSSSTLTGELYGSATHNQSHGYVELTPNANGQLGYLVYPKVPTNPTGLHAMFWFRAYGGSGADAVWLGVYDSTYSGTTEDIVKGGYHITFDEYQDRIAFTKSTIDNGPPIDYYTATDIDNGAWHYANITFWYDSGSDRVYVRVYYDGNLVLTSTDGSVQDNVRNGHGYIIVGGRTGGLTNYHLVGNGYLIVRKYIDPEPRVEVGPEEALNGRYIVRLIYLDLEPRLQSTRPTSLLIYPHKDIVRYVASGIGNLRIELYNVSSGTVIWSADLDDIIPGRDPSKPVDIVIVVKRIYVVMA